MKWKKKKKEKNLKRYIKQMKWYSRKILNSSQYDLRLMCNRETNTYIHMKCKGKKYQEKSSMASLGNVTCLICVKRAKVCASVERMRARGFTLRKTRETQFLLKNVLSPATKIRLSKRGMHLSLLSFFIIIIFLVISNSYFFFFFLNPLSLQALMGEAQRLKSRFCNTLLPNYHRVRLLYIIID